MVIGFEGYIQGFGLYVIVNVIEEIGRIGIGELLVEEVGDQGVGQEVIVIFQLGKGDLVERFI